MSQMRVRKHGGEQRQRRVRLRVAVVAPGTRRGQAERVGAGPRHAKTRFRQLVEHIPAIAYTQDIDDTRSFRYISPQVERILGYTPDEYTAKRGFMADLVHPDDRTAVDAADAWTNATGEPFRMEYRLRTSDGRYIWVRDEAVLGPDETGRSRIWQGVISDITERKEAEESLRLALSAAEMGTWDWDLTTGRLSWSEESELLHGLEPGAFSGQYQEFLDGLHPEDRPRVEAAVAAALAAGHDYVTEYRVVEPDGAVRWEFVKGKVIRDAAGRAVRMTGVAVDITARRQAEQQARDAESRYRALIERIAAVVYVDDVAADGERRVTRYVSPQIETLLGFTAAEWVTDPGLWEARVHPADRARTVAEVARTTATGEPFRVEYRLITRDGRTIWVLDEAIPALDEMGRPGSWHGILHDITERKAMEEQLAHQAFHDALTGLPNRALFADRLNHALRSAARRGEEVAVLFLDLDRFKVVNDSLGHEVGDRLLIEASERFTSCLRQADTIARFGGDEFVVLLEGATGEAARSIADRILAALQAPIRLAGQELFASASIGIAVSAPDRTTAGDLLRAADIALYQAKRAGRAIAVAYESGMGVQSSTWISLEADLRRAIARSELVLHFQPIVDLLTGRIRTLEALLRWAHPTRGLILPADVLPLAEETGLITEIGAWVLAETCARFRAWQRERPAAAQTVNVNLTARQLRDPDLVTLVARTLAAAGLDPRFLRLEITEEALIDELRATAGTLRALRELGVQLAIDDFGAGASSLASFRELAADELKLDRSFIRPLGHGGEDEAVVAAMTALAHRLGMRVTAEGIETAEQLAAVRRAGCDNGQGFLIHRPVPAEEIPALLRDGVALPPAAETAGHLSGPNGVARAADFVRV